MPLCKKKTKKCLAENIKEEIKSGKSREQAVAIAMAIFKKAK